MPLEALVFDIDGTLADTEEGHRCAFNLAFEHFGLGWHWERGEYVGLLRITGGKERLGRISRQGNRSIRQLLIVGAHSALLRSKEIRANAWVQNLLGRCARLKVAVALANKTARIAWTMMARGEGYRRMAPA